MIKNFYKTTSAIFFIYDITKRESFEILNFWISEAKEICLPKTIFVLIANQSDQEERFCLEFFFFTNDNI